MSTESFDEKIVSQYIAKYALELVQGGAPMQSFGDTMEAIVTAHVSTLGPLSLEDRTFIYSRIRETFLAVLAHNEANYENWMEISK